MYNIVMLLSWEQMAAFTPKFNINDFTLGVDFCEK